jgi:hypothetical protein
VRPVAAGQPVKWTDVVVDETSVAVTIRREMEQAFSTEAPAASA